MSNTEKDLKLPASAKIKVNWSDQPHNYSKEAKNKIRSYFANKYGINRNSINVVYQPVKINDKGEVIHLDSMGVDNIMDSQYQRSLMKEFLDIEKISVDFDRILALDDKINNELNIDLNASQHKIWSFKWININNFLSFGEDNRLDFNKIKGLTIVNSNPKNTGGKTTLTIDTFLFLLYGNTTKTKTNDEVFNQYSDKDELTVKGMLDIEGEDVIIERKMKRSFSKTGETKVVNKLNYYRLLPDGNEEILNEEDAKKTTKTIGNQKDFEMLVLCNERNLDDLVGLTTTESGKLLTRLIGLEILELKEAACRKMINTFEGKRKSNQYDVITLTNEILQHETNLNDFKEIQDLLNQKLLDVKKEIEDLTKEKEEVLNNKEKIDVVISELNPSNLEKEIEEIKNKGISLNDKVKDIKEEVKKIGDVLFDEDTHYSLTKELNLLNSSVAVKKAEIDRITKVVKDLINGGICQSCNRKLDNVDNSEHIKKHESDKVNIINEVDTISSRISVISSEIAKIDVNKKLVDTKNKLELDSDRLEVEIGSLRNKISSKINDLKKYNLNLEVIESNKKKDIEITRLKTKIDVSSHTKDELISKIEKIKGDISSNYTSIDDKNKIIETLVKEEDIAKIFKVYLTLVSKKGISKIVLRSVLPIINSEVQRLLDDVCDFEIEVYMDEKNDVQFLLNNDGVTKLIKSGSGFEKTAASLALRAVLGKTSTLPMPNFITFDEVFGKVALENIDKLKPLFDKIKDMYDIVFVISHNDLVKDFGDNIITVEKNNNISSLKLI